MKRCLIVDDSSVIRKVARRILENFGFTVLEASDGRQALDTCVKDMPDAILLDWNMPVMDGYTTLCNIRADERFREIPVMMVTTEAERENVVRAIQAGANNYLCKPFSPQDLTTKVMESLGMGLDM